MWEGIIHECQIHGANYKCDEQQGPTRDEESIFQAPFDDSLNHGVGKCEVELRVRSWQELPVTTITLELERSLERLAPEKARILESRVREVISEMESEKEMPTLEEMKRRMPEFADLIGSWADVEFEIPEDLPLPPAKTW